ncbi:MAG: hypothetical protein OET44_00450 [Gammaproteobacteria bacterium]|nr:hypothetical protein [Gammaproteobacteria bacterium]
MTAEIRVRAIAGLPLLVAALLAPVSGHAQALTTITEIGRSGAPGLALRLMDSQQPDSANDPAAWFEWERARIAMLVQWRQWQRGLARLDAIPAGMPPATQRWAATQRAWFRLALGDAPAARRDLRRLLWHNPSIDAAQRSAWRQLIVRSYLLEDDFDDAVTAMRRYQQDYRDAQPAWRVLRARVLLSAGQTGRVESILEGITTPEADALRTLDRLRQRAASPAKVFEETRKRAESIKSPQDKARAWAIAVHAAEAMSSSAWVALALDQGIRYAAALDRNDKLFALDARQLWAAYHRYGRLVGNSVQLLVGNDLAWMEEAEKSLPLAPIRARALLSVVAFEGASAEIRELAHGRLATLLAREPGGFFVLRELYLDTDRFPDIADVPASVRYRLADFALSRADIELATQIMSTLDSAPAGADVFEWQLRRARILTMGGRSDAAAAALHTLLESNHQPSAAALDRLLQVVFDLQAVGADQAVVGVLERVLAQPITPEQRREILFWRAESWKALHKYTLAAHDFMRSATLLDPQAADPWGQTARYNAAESLSEAGLVDDAERIYRALLRVTEDADRKGVLRMRLQQLWLRDAAQDNVGRD